MHISELESGRDAYVDRKAHNPGLELGGRRSYAQGLEVYRNPNGKYPEVQGHPVSRYIHTKPISLTPGSAKKLPDLPPTVRSRVSKTWIIAILSIFLVATIIAASVAVAVVVKKDSNDDNNAANHNPISANATTSTSSANPPTFTSKSPIPLSDCSSLNSTYTIRTNTAQAINADVNFAINCGQDEKLPLVMGIRMYSFEDCMSACASQATNAQDISVACIAAVYKPNSGQPLTCWLKSKGDENAGVQGGGVDTALVMTG